MSLLKLQFSKQNKCCFKSLSFEFVYYLVINNLLIVRTQSILEVIVLMMMMVLVIVPAGDWTTTEVQLQHFILNKDLSNMGWP